MTYNIEEIEEQIRLLSNCDNRCDECYNPCPETEITIEMLKEYMTLKQYESR